MLLAAIQGAAASQAVEGSTFGFILLVVAMGAASILLLRLALARDPDEDRVIDESVD